MADLSLFDPDVALLDPLHVDVEVPVGASCAERARAFHQANPAVYDRLRLLALALVSRGQRRFGIAMLFEQLRWTWAWSGRDLDGFKLNNSYRAFYARMLMDNEPALVGVFTTRQVRS